MVSFNICFTNAQNKSGTDRWPFIDYSYAKAFMYNLSSDIRGNYEVIKEGNLDSTVVGQGKLLDSVQVSTICSITNKEIRGLLVGFSKTFLPHHAIVFYNNSDNPIAWIAIGFECEGIRTSPKIKYKEFKKEMSEKEIRYCEKQLAAYKNIIRKCGLPIFKRNEEYRQYYFQNAF